MSGSFPLGGLLNHVKRQFIWNIDVDGRGEGHFATIFVLYLGLSICPTTMLVFILGILRS